MRGFTLIELLVVIAIIGILSAVVLVSVNETRDKGRDAAVKSSMQTIRVQSELYYIGAGGSGYGSASGDCSTADTMWADDPTIVAAIAEIDRQAASSPVCNSSDEEWAISAGLNEGNHWCTDERGIAREIANALGSGETECP